MPMIRERVPTAMEGVCWAWEERQRATGRTRTLVDALPADGRCVILVLSLAASRHIQDEIRKSRGDEFPMRKVRFVSVESNNPADVYDLPELRGLQIPIFVDHTVTLRWTLHHVATINAVLGER